MKYLLIPSIVALALGLGGCNRRSTEDEPASYPNGELVSPSVTNIPPDPMVVADQNQVSRAWLAAQAAAATPKTTGPATPAGPPSTLFAAGTTLPATQPGKAPAKEPATVPAKEPAKEPAAEPAKEPAKEPAAEPAKEPAAEPAKPADADAPKAGE